ncbi:hypothetical protein JCM15519_34690 [Fundidesulfovibrio butyratiphilus]
MAKLESKNPGGSIKDRVALAMIEAAEASGELTPGKTVIEATSGNTGIGLAMVCAVRGYPITLIMSASASEERKRILRAYGAQIRLTPGHMGTDGAIEEAYRLAREHPEKYVLMDQYNNQASIEAHYRGTGQEIWDQTDGRVTHVVATLGTTGTAMGIAKRLKELNPAVKIVAVEPGPGHRIQGLKNMQESYPPGIYDKRVMDMVLRVEDEEAFSMARRMAREEGVLAGMSGGAAVAGAVRVCSELESGLVVVILPDSGERYLSTDLFSDPAEKGLALSSVEGDRLVHPATGAGLGLYTPGPSLDEPGDAQCWRRIALLDVLARHQGQREVSCRLGVGLADLEDRTLAAARAQGLSREDFLRQVRVELADLALSMGSGAAFTAAGDAVDDMPSLVRKLMGKGLCYEKLRSVYFDVARDKDYGSLSHADLSKLALGKTVDLDAYLKDHPQDFTLFKRVSLQDLKLDQMVRTEWGNVRPSWFLQMAVCAMKGLDRLSVVLAGEGQAFPHLENLRAIWRYGYATAPQVWMVCGAMRGQSGQGLDVRDLARSMGSFGAVRMWLLGVHYRKPLDASEKTLAMWTRNWRKVQEAAANALHTCAPGAHPSQEAKTRADELTSCLDQAVEDDLSLHRFWPRLFAYCRQANACAPGEAQAYLEGLRSVDAVLGVLDRGRLPLARADWPEGADVLVGLRENARAAKSFEQADQLRAEIESLGLRVEDTPAGSRLYAVES